MQFSSFASHKEKMLVTKKYITQVIVFVFLFMPFFAAKSLAQNIGVNRASIKWQQINTPHSRIIFQPGQDSIAKRVATLTDVLGEQYRGTVGEKVKKIDIILQSENTISNGYVGMGPYRSELYMTPPQDPFELGSNNWADQLAIHEFRHAQQFSNYNIGLSKVGSILAGQYGQAIANSISIPNWFWEGDAIWNETIHTQQGRGRLPFFFNPFKSLDQSGRTYDWLKLRNGSLKDFVPNHYHLGYLLVAYGREKYGDSIWNNITREAASFKGLFYPIEKSVKRHTGNSYSTFTKEALGYYAAMWKQEAEKQPNWLTKTQKNNVVNFRYPYPTTQGSFIALKTSFRQIPIFVEIDSLGNEKRISVKDIGYEDYFSYRGDTIIYTAYQPDARWDNRDYSIIVILDITRGEQKRVTTKTRYFSPDICKNKIVTIKATPGLPSEVHILNENGEVLKAFSADSSFFYSHPKWTEDGERVIVAVRKPNGDMGWLEWELQSGRYQWLMEPRPGLVGFPVVHGNILTFTHTVEGKDVLKAMLLHNGKRFLLASHPTGIYQGFIQNGMVIGSVFTAEGYRMATWELPKSSLFEPESTTHALPTLYTKAARGQTYSDLTHYKTRNYSPEKYRKSFRLFNFHSWIPEPNEPDYTFTVVGENVLSTLSTELFYNYNTNERFHRVGARWLFGDSYVMPFLNVSQTWGREVVLNKDTILSSNESEIGAGLLLPLNLSGGKYVRRLTLSSGINIDNIKWTGLAKTLLNDQNVTASVNRLTYIARSQQAIQQIYPRFAQTVILDFRSAISSQTAQQFLANTAFYFPGLHVNHNVVLTLAYQSRDTMQEYFFPNSFPFSRGYNALNYPRMWRVGFNYHFPLFYPDWGFGGIVYFQRVRANAFFDHTIGRSLRTGRNTPFNSAGAEVFFDTKWWNIERVSFGLRYSFLLNNDLLSPARAGLFEFVLPIDLFGR